MWWLMENASAPIATPVIVAQTILALD